jgi:hypothetical protein
MKCYYDGSGDGVDKNGDKWITLAGVAATDSAWADFDIKWNRMLRERYPVAPYIHMIEVMDHNDPFDQKNGWDLPKKPQLISDAIVILSQMDKDEFRWFRCSINESAVDRIARDGEYFPADMHKHLSLVLAEFMVTPYWNNCLLRGKAPEDIFLFYDRGERFISCIKREWLKRRSDPNRLVMDATNVWDRIKDIVDVDQAFAPPVQVADMVAWAHTRALPTDEQREFSDLKAHLIKFVPSTNLDLTEQILREHSQMVKEGAE